MIPGLVKLFLFQAVGELVSNFLIPFIPGPVIGLVLLLAFLVIRRRLPADIDTVGSTILQHLGLLFIPASVGVILVGDLFVWRAGVRRSIPVVRIQATVNSWITDIG